MFPKMICSFSMQILMENDNPSHNKKKKPEICIELQNIPNRQSNIK